MRSVLLLLVLATACDLFGGERPITAEVQDVQTEFRTIFAAPAHIETHPKQMHGEEVYDVTVKFERTPPGYTPDQIRANANIVVRKHIRKVHDVEVIF